MKNTSTTLELPEGSKATISGKNIDGKNYLVVEVEERKPEWTKFKRGDVLVKPAVCKRDEIFVIFEEYMVDSNHTYFNCIFNNANDGETYWVSELFRKATDAEKARFFKWLEKEKGLEWDGEKLELVEIPDVPEWKKFKRGDVLVDRECWGNKFVLFDEYVGGSNRSCFNCIYNNMDKSYGGLSKRFCKATDKEKAEFFKWLRDEEGLEWDGEKLVEVLKEGDMAIFWDVNPRDAFIDIYKGFRDGCYVSHRDAYWDNALKWDGTKEQYEKVLRGEL